MTSFLSPVSRIAGFLTLLGLLFGSEAMGQDYGSGTVYSRYGLGELKHFSSSQIEALGGGGTALRSFNYLNARNPASWSDQFFTRAMVGAKYQQLQATDAADNTSQLALGSLNAVQFSFPLLTRELGVGLAFVPYSRVNYQVALDDRIQPDPTAPDTADYRIHFEGRGGLQQFSAGLGYRFNNNLSVGASADIIFGIFEDARRTQFITSGFASSNLSTSTRLWGLTGTFGGIFTEGSVLREEDELSIGASLTLPAHLTGKQVNTLGQGLDRDTLTTVQSGSITVPLRTRLGAAYRPGERWLFLADGEYEPWSQFEHDFPQSRRFPPSPLRSGSSRAQQYADRLRLSGGLEVVPAGEDQVAPYFARAAYRLGGYYEQLYVKPFSGSDLTAQDVRTLAVTGGVSLPTLISGTRLDLNLAVGTRGTTEQNLVRDVFYRVSLNVNIGERWFQQRRLR